MTELKSHPAASQDSQPMLQSPATLQNNDISAVTIITINDPFVITVYHILYDTHETTRQMTFLPPWHPHTIMKGAQWVARPLPCCSSISYMFSLSYPNEKCIVIQTLYYIFDFKTGILI